MARGKEPGKGPCTLADIPLGSSARIESVGGSGSLRQHFLDMGLIPQAEVTAVKLAPMGDPLQLRVHGYDLTLRLDDARRIAVSPLPEGRDHHCKADHSQCERCWKQTPIEGGVYPGGHPHEREHPGLGEQDASHERIGRDRSLESRKLTFALAGNQNCGKTTLFNQLTGANQHVGNFPGVTVDRAYGAIRGHANTQVTDLPGIYSMSPYTQEEIVTREFLLNSTPDAIINIVDATNIERNMYLTMQLLELDVPMVLALNMMDEVAANGGSVLVNELEARLGIPVVPISAVKGQGVEELIDHALRIAATGERPRRHDFCGARDNGGSVHRCLHGIMHLIEDHAERAQIPVRFAASKLAEGDSMIARALDLDQNEVESVEHLILQMESERGLDRAAAIADMRFNYIMGICSNTVVKPRESREHARSAAIDRILTGRFTAIPAFIAIMALVFWLTFGVIGAFLQNLLETGIGALGDLTAQAMEAANVNATVQSLVIDGIFGGVGAVVSFVPLIAVLFFFLSMLEDSGYMARVAFVMDKLLRKIGLSGRSIVPMLIGFGCSVPAVMASRTLPSKRDRTMTILLTPFMSCSAKLPIYSFLAAAFFPDRAALVMVLLYFGGIAVGILVALAFKGTLFKGEAVPFVMELPNYRLPGAKNVAHLLWDKVKDFLQRAFTIIFLATVIIWFLQTFDPGLNVVEDSSQSILALLAGGIAPVLTPLGLGDWRIATALLTGFIAKESVVATMGVLFGGTAAITAAIAPAAAAALLAFCLLYTPCVAAIASVKRELGLRWALAMVVGQCAIAWAAAFAVHALCTAIGV